VPSSIRGSFLRCVKRRSTCTTADGTLALLQTMNIEAEFEEQEEGHWIARIPDLPVLVAGGRTRHEAGVELTARVLRLLAERIQNRAFEIEDDQPPEIFQSIAALDDVAARLVEMVALTRKADNIPNEETIAAIEELESGGGESASSLEEFFAKLNADD
jgi:predicted RNase H-like HicB family nuclease